MPDGGAMKIRIRRAATVLAGVTAILAAGCGAEREAGDQGPDTDDASSASTRPDEPNPGSPNSSTSFNSIANLAAKIGCDNPEVTLDRDILATEGQRADTYEGDGQEFADDLAEMSDVLLQSNFLESGTCEIEGLFITLQVYEGERPDDYLASSDGKTPSVVLGYNWVAEVFDFSSSEATSSEIEVAGRIAEAAEGSFSPNE